MDAGIILEDVEYRSWKLVQNFGELMRLQWKQLMESWASFGLAGLRLANSVEAVVCNCSWAEGKSSK